MAYRFFGKHLTDRPTFTALKHRDFRMMWTANALSSIARWAMLVGNGWLVFQLSEGSSTWVGIAMFSFMIPRIIVPPFGGLLADRMDRRNLVVFNSAFLFAVTCLLAVLSISGIVQVWHVVTVAFLSGAAQSLQEPAIQALVPNQVPKENLFNAIALTGVARHGSRAAGPALALPLIATVGVSGAFAIATLFYAFSTIQVLRVNTVSRGETQSKLGLTQDLIAGLSYVYSHRMVALLIIMVAFHCSLTMSYESLIPVFSMEELHGGGTAASALMTATGVGALIGTLFIAGIREEKQKGTLYLWTGIFSGISPMVMSISTNWPMAVLSIALIGASQGMFMSISNTYVQSIVPDRLRGRISSIYVLHAGGIMAFSNLANGFFADMFSAPIVFFATGTFFVIVMLTISALYPIMRQVYRTGTLTTV